MEIIKGSINLEDKKAIYHMTLDPARSSVQDLKGNILMLTDYVLYTDVDSQGEPRRIMSITDEQGAVYTTISESFIREAEKIIDLFGTPVSVKILSDVGKKGREFIYCTIAD